MTNPLNLVKGQPGTPSNPPLADATIGAPNYQTVRLSRGKHRSPREGACVMELASMLAGRRFSDWVPCVDPAIGAFLRGYNDHLSDELRQDLYRYAATVLDTWVDVELAERRAEMCRTWALQARSVRASRLPWSLRFRRQGRFEFADCEFAGVYAARFARRDRAWHTRTLGFIDMLVAVGSRPEESTTPAAVPALPPEATWDFPGHGSRSGNEGDVLEGPGVASLEDRAGALAGSSSESA